MDLDNFDFVPHGDVTISYAWNTKATEFEYGNRQYNRTRIHAKKSYGFRVGGSESMLDRLMEFFDSHHGKADPFLFTYDGVTEKCYFADTMVVNLHRENAKIVGGECDIVLEVDKQVTNYPKPSTDDILPLSRGDINYTLDWRTDVYTTSSTQRRVRYAIPTKKMEITITGGKSTRDKLIELFNSHEMMPLKMVVGGKTYDVRFPSDLEITDKREGSNIIGFESKLEVQICNPTNS